MSGLMVALFWITLQVYLPLVLGSSLISQRHAGGNAGRVTLIVSVLMVSLVLMILLIGPFLLVFWLSGLLSKALFIGLLVVWTLRFVVFHMFNYLFFLSFGLVRGCLWRRLILAIFDKGVQFQCRLFRLVQALIFDAPVVSSVP